MSLLSRQSLCILLMLLSLTGQAMAGVACGHLAELEAAAEPVESAHCGGSMSGPGSVEAEQPSNPAMECCDDQSCPMQLCIGAACTVASLPELLSFARADHDFWLVVAPRSALSSNLYRPPIHA